MCDGISEAFGLASAAESAGAVGSSAYMGASVGTGAFSGVAMSYAAPVAASTTPWLAYAGIGASLLSGGIQMAGQAQSAAAQRAAAQYNAQIAANNAQAAMDQGRFAEQQQRMKNAALLSQQKANLAANGVEIDSGSALDVQSSSAQMGELDALTIRYNAQNKANNYLSQAGLSQMTADAAETAGTIGVASSMLGTASSVSDKWLTYQNKGIMN